MQSVSAWPEKRGEIKKMMEMAAKDIERLGGTVEMVDIGKQKVSVSAVVLLMFFWNFFMLLLKQDPNSVPNSTKCILYRDFNLSKKVAIYYTHYIINVFNAASFWRGDPPASYRAGAIGVRPW